MTKFTLGPWTTKSGMHRAWICGLHNGVDVWAEKQAAPGESYEWGEREADANLIAAAPEMYAALEALLRRYGMHSNHDIRNAILVLAKARGEIP